MPPLRPLVAPPLTHEDLDALEADAATGYVDDDRPHDAATAEVAYEHSRRVATGLQALLNERGADPTLLASASDLLGADRRTAAAMLSDAEILAGHTHGHSDQRDLGRARDFLARGDEAWHRGQPVSAVAQWRQAVDRAWDILDRHGIRYTQDADLDGDRVPDLLELPFGANPLLAAPTATG